MIVKIISLLLFAIATASACYFSFHYINKRQSRLETGKTDAVSEEIRTPVSCCKPTVIVVCVIAAVFSIVLGLLIYDRTTSVLNFYRIAFLFITSCMVAISDITLRIIPNLFVLLTLSGGAVFHIADVILCAVAQGDPKEKLSQILMLNILSAVAVVLVLCVLSAVTHSGMGFGDIKYLGALCFSGGLLLFFVSLSASLICGLVAAVFLMVGKKKDKKYTIPFAPFILAGVTVSILTGLI